MPTVFGPASFDYYSCSIYCTYIPAKGKNKSAEIVAQKATYGDLKVYPNPFSDRLRFEFVSPETVHAKIVIYDITGRQVAVAFDNPVEGGVTYNAEFKPEKIISAMYIYRIILGETVYNGKVLYKKE